VGFFADVGLIGGDLPVSAAATIVTSMLSNLQSPGPVLQIFSKIQGPTMAFSPLHSSIGLSGSRDSALSGLVKGKNLIPKTVDLRKRGKMVTYPD
jgi:hypothetical protein